MQKSHVVFWVKGTLELTDKSKSSLLRSHKCLHLVWLIRPWLSLMVGGAVLQLHHWPYWTNKNEKGATSPNLTRCNKSCAWVCQAFKWLRQWLSLFNYFLIMFFQKTPEPALLACQDNFQLHVSLFLRHWFKNENIYMLCLISPQKKDKSWAPSAQLALRHLEIQAYEVHFKIQTHLALTYEFESVSMERGFSW